MDAASTPSDETSGLVRRGQRLEHLTLAWNLIEAAVAIGAGVTAGSVSLVGFGVDSLIECSSAGVLLWQLRDARTAARRERTALRLVGVCFLLLAAYVAVDAGKALIARERPEVSAVGIALAALSLAVMPLLARAKRLVAGGLKSAALHADARQTDLCAYLSAILLAGLALNAALDWWWADPVAALLMVPIIAREGIEALRGNACPDCHT